MIDIDRVLKPDEVIERLKNARTQCINGYYYVAIRPNVRDRIVELLKAKNPKPKSPVYMGGYAFCPNCETTIKGYDKEKELVMNWCPYCGQEVKWE